jgi:hypothetical protein
MCKDCYKSTHKQEAGGWYRLVCNNDAEGIGVNGFHVCPEFATKCSKCKHYGKYTYETPCFLCGSLYLRPYFSLEVANDVD